MVPSDSIKLCMTDVTNMVLETGFKLIPHMLTFLQVLRQQGAQKRAKLIESLYVDLSQRVSRVEQKCTDEEFSNRLTSVAFALFRDSREDKLAIFRRILEDTYSAELDDNRSRLFVAFVDRFEIFHMSVIRVLSSGVGLDLGADGQEKAAFGFAYIDGEVRRITGQSGADMTDVVTFAISELVQSGLIHTRVSKAKAGIPIINLNSVGLLRMQVFHLSALGLMFARYVATSGKDGGNG